MATTPRKKKSPAEIKAALAAAKKKVAELEQKAYKSELDELINSMHFVAEFNSIKTTLKEVSDVAILLGIANACGVKRLQISQQPPKPRGKKASANSAALKTSKSKAS